MSTTVLWIHVICGVAWIAICGTIVIVLLALSGDGAELRRFVTRGAPRLNRLCLGCAAVIPLTGLLNLMFVAKVSRFGPAREFVAIVGTKVVIFGLMAGAQWLVIDLFATMYRPLPEDAAGDRSVEGALKEHVPDSITKSLVRLYAAIAALGGVALGMGIWLAGV